MRFAFLNIFSLLAPSHILEKSSFKSEIDSRPIMVACGPNLPPCPHGSMCIKLYGKEGICVLTD